MVEIRNFCIIAHIDHGKSTLADRLLELTGTVERRDMKEQLLDKMELERERGITIKLAPVRMEYAGCSLNLIDTPGHVDFSYEVSRSLAACEGALVVVDASQGIQAQTLANVQLAREAGLALIPVINKIDLPAAQLEATSAQIVSLLGCKESEILAVSAKTGAGVTQVLEGLGRTSAASPDRFLALRLRALIFDSYYDDFRGVVLYVRLFDGRLKAGDELLMMASKTKATALEVGHLNPQMQSDAEMAAGEIGYIVTNLKTTAEARVGDTVTSAAGPAEIPLPGYRPAKSYIFAGLFPADSSLYDNLKKALAKLALSDSTLSFEAENSPVLGHGFRCGFLGLLHLDIVVERLRREYGLEMIISNPSTAYKVTFQNGREETITAAVDLPEASKIASIAEPFVKGEIVCRQSQVGAMIQLVNQARGLPGVIEYVDELAVLQFEAPLANLLTDFYDRLKSLSSGYGSLNYELAGWRPDNLVRVDFYVAHEMVGALSLICHRSEARSLGGRIVERLKEIIPRQQFKVALQAAIGGKFIARADLPAFRKDVTAKLYGGDSTRRKKLLEQQKKGKARLKRVGKVDLPADTFTVLLKKDGSR